MNRLQNAWKPLLLGLVLMAVLVGVAGAVPTDQPSALSTQRKLVISSGEFQPVWNSPYYNAGEGMHTLQDHTDVGFVAPVDFPTHQRVTVDKLELHAWDNNNDGRMQIWLYRFQPSTGYRRQMAYLDTGVLYTDPLVHTWQDTTIGNSVKSSTQDTYLYAKISDETNLLLFGATIYYRVGS